jgi:hypothetical protein
MLSSHRFTAEQSMVEQRYPTLTVQNRRRKEVANFERMYLPTKPSGRQYRRNNTYCGQNKSLKPIPIEVDYKTKNSMCFFSSTTKDQRIEKLLPPCLPCKNEPPKSHN